MTDQPNTADVSCRICGSGWWVTNPEKFAWSGCEDCAKKTSQYAACSFALGRGRYCKGDARFPATHATACPSYSEEAAS